MKFSSVQLFSRSSILLIASLIFITALAPKTLAEEQKRDFNFYTLPESRFPEPHHHHGHEGHHHDVHHGDHHHGLETGLERGEKTLIIHLLERRFGNLSDDVEERINNLSLHQTESLGEALLDFKTKEDLMNWLDSYS